MMGNFTKNNRDNFRWHVVLACDLIMLSSVCLSLFYVLYVELSYLTGWLVFNAVSIVIFKHWLCDSLQIPWLLSPFNRAIKRLGDIVASILFLLTLFPLLFLAQTLVTKKRYTGPVLSVRKVRIGEGTPFLAVLFNQKFVWDIAYFRYSPIAFSILLGTVSIWDLALLHECPEDVDDKPEALSDFSYDKETIKDGILAETSEDKENTQKSEINQ